MEHDGRLSDVVIGQGLLDAPCHADAGWEGEDPSHNDLSGDAPPHGRKTLSI